VGVAVHAAVVVVVVVVAVGVVVQVGPHLQAEMYRSAVVPHALVARVG